MAGLEQQHLDQFPCVGSQGWLQQAPAPPSALSLSQIFESQRMKFSEIPQRLHALLMPPEPIIINHVIR